MGHDVDAILEIRKCTLPSAQKLSVGHPFQVFICLRFGTGEGEGGSFALFQGLYPPPRQDMDSDRVLTGDSAYKAKSVSGTGHLPKRLRWPIFAWVGQQLAHSALQLP